MKLKNQMPLPLIKFLTRNLQFILPAIFFFAFTSCQHYKRQKNIFHYNEQSGIATLDPAFAKNQSIMWAVHQLYNTLVQTDNNLNLIPVSYTHLRAHETGRNLVCRLLLEKKKKK